MWAACPLCLDGISFGAQKPGQPLQRGHWPRSTPLRHRLPEAVALATARSYLSLATPASASAADTAASTSARDRSTSAAARRAAAAARLARSA